jgi:hypothetical protein
MLRKENVLVTSSRSARARNRDHLRIGLFMYKVVQIWPGQTVTCLHTISSGHIWTTLYVISL